MKGTLPVPGTPEAAVVAAVMAGHGVVALVSDAPFLEAISGALAVAGRRDALRVVTLTGRGHGAPVNARIDLTHPSSVAGLRAYALDLAGHGDGRVSLLMAVAATMAPSGDARLSILTRAPGLESVKAAAADGSPEAAAYFSKLAEAAADGEGEHSYVSTGLMAIRPALDLMDRALGLSHSEGLPRVNIVDGMRRGLVVVIVGGFRNREAESWLGRHLDGLLEGIDAPTLLATENRSGPKTRIGVTYYGGAAREAVDHEAYATGMAAFHGGGVLTASGRVARLLEPNGKDACIVRARMGVVIAVAYLFEREPDGWCNAWDVGAGLRTTAKALDVHGDEILSRYLHDRRLNAFPSTEQAAPQTLGVALDVLLGPGISATHAERAIHEEFLVGVDVPLIQACLCHFQSRILWRWAREGVASRRRDFVVAWRSLGVIGLDPVEAERIDAGERTLPIVARTLGLDEARTRRLVGRDGDLPRYGQAYLFDWMRALPLDAIPARGDGVGWSTFVEECHLLQGVAGDAYEASGYSLRAEAASLLARSSCDWHRPGYRVLQMSTGQRYVSDALVRLGDLVAVALDQFPREDNGHIAVAASIALDFATVRGIRLLSQGWHADPALHGGRGSVADDASWPPLFDGEVDLGDGCYATCIATAAGLGAEGAVGIDAEGMMGLGHCVRSYADVCLAGRSHIVSMRIRANGTPVRLSTVEFRHVDGAWKVVQHHGLANARPDVDQRARATELTRRIATGAVAVVASSTPRTWPIVGGIPPEALPGLLALWRPLLPRRWARLRLPAFREAIRERAEIVLKAEPPNPEGPGV